MSELIYKISLAVLPSLYVWLTNLLFSTCRMTVRNRHHLDEALAHGPVIVPFWHYSIFYIFYHMRKYPGVALVSASRDGEYIARIAEKLNFETVRGSSHRQGVQALKGLLRGMKSGRHVGIVADGSQGPARVMQPGAVYLASKTGAPIFPVAWAVDRGWFFRSWDRMVLPIPFSKIVLYYGELMYIPRDLNDEGIEQHRLLVEQSLNGLYRQAWSEFGREQHDSVG